MQGVRYFKRRHVLTAKHSEEVDLCKIVACGQGPYTRERIGEGEIDASSDCDLAQQIEPACIRQGIRLIHCIVQKHYPYSQVGCTTYEVMDTASV